MHSTLSSSRENILNDDSLQFKSQSRESILSSNYLNNNNNRNKSAVSNRISSAVANTREASNKLNVNGQYPVSVPQEVEYDDDFIIESRDPTFINDNTKQENLSEDAIIEELTKATDSTNDVSVNKRVKTAQFLSPLKQSRNLNSKLDKLPNDNENVLPYKTLTGVDLALMEAKAKNARLSKMPPLKPISNGNFNNKINEAPKDFPVIMSQNDSFQMETNESREDKIETQDKKLVKMYEKIKKDIQKDENRDEKNSSKRPVVEQQSQPLGMNQKKPEKPIVKENPNDFIEVKKENPKMKYFWISLIIIGGVLLALLAIVLGVVLSARSNQVAQMVLQIPMFNITNTTTTTTTTTSTTMTTTTTTTTTTAKTCELTTTPTQTQLISYSYSCPNNAIYLPTYLSQTNIYSYGYAINQQIVCANSILNLICPSNQYIHIYSAYFGIQSTTLSTCISITASTPSYCFNKAAFDKINSTCELASNCSLIADATNLQGEPCQSFSKHLLVQYQCVDYNTAIKLNQCPVNKNTSTACPYQNDPSIQTKQWCEPSVMEISCPASSQIKIVCAYYGIDSNYQCTSGYYTGAPTSCYSVNSQQLIMSACNGKSTCSILGNPTYQVYGFTDPCYGYSKILYVQYKCINSTTIVSTTTNTSPSTSTLPYCQNLVTPPGTCSSISKSQYVASFLSPNQTSFTYPIMQQIVCLGSIINIVCPINTVIHIYSAYFGIQSDTSVPGCFFGTLERPAMCYYSKSFNYINTSCEYKQSCSISADTTTLGDACPNSIEKQLLIQYQCVDSYALNSTINNCNSFNASVPLICPVINVTNLINSTNTNTSLLSNLTTITSQQIWCDGNKMNITCGNNKNISILCAYYGLHPSLSSSCGISSMLPDIPVCYFKSSFTQLYSLCSNQKTCLINNISTYFADPCNGQTKALFVQWKCN